MDIIKWTEGNPSRYSAWFIVLLKDGSVTTAEWVKGDWYIQDIHHRGKNVEAYCRPQEIINTEDLCDKNVSVINWNVGLPKEGGRFLVKYSTGDIGAEIFFNGRTGHFSSNDVVKWCSFKELKV